MQNETATSTVYVNGEQAKKELTALEQRANAFRKQMQEANKAGDLKSFTKAERNLKATQSEIRKLTKESFDLKKVLDNLSGATLSDLNKAQKQIQANMRKPHVKRGSKEWKEYRDQLVSVKTAQREVNNELKAGMSGWEKFSFSLRRAGGSIAALLASVTGLSIAIRNSTQEALRMTDVYANVQKYTGESAEDIASMNEDLKNMDTRTSRAELNRLMGEAGKLGKKGREDLLGFVRAADMIQVALGEDLGEDAVKNIGKLSDMFGITEEMGLEKGMLATASAINEVAQNSTASEPYLLNFTNRLSGMGKAAGLSIPQIIGLGSVLDQNGQQVEMASTAVNKFLATLATSSEKVAQAVGLPAKELEQVVRKDMNEALLMVFRQLNQKGGLVDLAPLFKDLGTEGARAASVITILADKVGNLEREQNLANQSFQEGISVITEFNTQNNTQQAQLDKSKKLLFDQAEELGKRFIPATITATQVSTSFVKGLITLLKWLNDNKITLILLTTAMVGYTVAVNASVVADKLKVFWNEKLIKTFKALWNIIKTNPYAAGLAVITILIGKLLDYNRNLSKTIDLQKEQNKINEEATQNTREEIIELEQLKKILLDSSKGYDVRKNALERIKEIVPGYHAELTKEGELIENNISALDDYAKKLVLTEKIKLAVAKQSEAEDALRNFVKDYENDLKKLSVAIARANEQVETGQADNVEQALGRMGLDVSYRTLTEMRAKLNENIDSYKKLVDQYYNELNDIGKSSPAGTSIPDDPDGTGEKPEKERQRLNNTLSTLETEHLKKMSDIKKRYQQGDIKTEFDYNQELLKQQDAYDEKRKAALNSLLSEFTDENLRIDISKQIATIDSKNIDRQINEINKLKKIILEADPVEQEKQSYQNRLQELGLFGKKREELTDEQLNVLNLLEEQHTQNLNKLNTKESSLELKRIENLQADELKILAERREKEEIIEKQYNDERLKTELKFLREKLNVQGLSNRKIEEINKQINEKLTQITISGMNDRNKYLEQYGVKSVTSQKEMELSILKYYLDQGIISEQEAAKIRTDINSRYLSNLADKYGKTFNAIDSIAGNFYNASANYQSAEEKAIETKYNRQIELAKKAGKDTTALEEQNEKEIAQIRAENADKQFVLTVASVIAKTAESAMNAYASASDIPVIGHILGPIAAGAAVAYGASQIKIAKAQQEAAKAGYAEGGFTPNVGKHTVAGSVHGGEFVASMEATRHTPFRKVFDLVDYAQKTNTIARIDSNDVVKALGIRRGYASGGYVTPAAVPDSSGDSLYDVKNMMLVVKQSNKINNALLKTLKQGIDAKVYVTGQNGIKQGIDTYNKLINNVTK